MSTANTSSRAGRDRRRFEILWYMQSFLYGFILLYPVYAIWMLDDGLTPAELSTLFILWAGSAMVFEVPSGILADRFSRAALLAFSYVLKAAGFAVWWASSGITGYAAGFLLWALSGALLSGARESLLFDTLRQSDAEDRFETVYGRSESMYLVGLLGALTLGGALAESGRDGIYLLSIIVPLTAALLCAFGLREPREQRATEPTETPFLPTLREGVAISLASRLTLLTLATFALLNLVPEALDEYEAPLLDQLPGLTPAMIGLLLSVLTLAQIGGNLLADRLSSGGLRRVLSLYGVTGLVLIPIDYAPVWLVITLLALLCGLHGLASVLLQGALQRGIADSARSTVTSLASFAQSAMALPFYGAFGWYATGHGFVAAFTMTGLCTVVVAALIGLAVMRTDQQHPTGHSEGPEP